MNIKKPFKLVGNKTVYVDYVGGGHQWYYFDVKNTDDEYVMVVYEDMTGSMFLLQDGDDHHDCNTFDAADPETDWHGKMTDLISPDGDDHPYTITSEMFQQFKPEIAADLIQWWAVVEVKSRP